MTQVLVPRHTISTRAAADRSGSISNLPRKCIPPSVTGENNADVTTTKRGDMKTKVPRSWPLAKHLETTITDARQLFTAARAYHKVSQTHRIDTAWTCYCHLGFNPLGLPFSLELVLREPAIEVVKSMLQLVDGGGRIYTRIYLRDTGDAGIYLVWNDIIGSRYLAEVSQGSLFSLWEESNPTPPPPPIHPREAFKTAYGLVRKASAVFYLSRDGAGFDDEEIQDLLRQAGQYGETYRDAAIYADAHVRADRKEEG